MFRRSASAVWRAGRAAAVTVSNTNVGNQLSRATFATQANEEAKVNFVVVI